VRTQPCWRALVGLIQTILNATSLDRLKKTAVLSLHPSARQPVVPTFRSCLRACACVGVCVCVCLWRRRCKWLVLVVVLVMVRVIATIYALRGSKGCAAISRRCLRIRPPSRCVLKPSTESIRARMSTASTDLRPRQAQRHVV
jgi:hypothetical protein